MENLKYVIAQNIQSLRVSNGLTQLELAEKLNYSDKSVSKWERGTAIPDVFVLKQMADIFGVKVDDFLILHEENNPIKYEPKKVNRFLISLLACGLVWLVATFLYVVLLLFRVPGAWKTFIYALPTTMIVAIVFSTMWGKRWCTGLAVSIFIWSALICIYISFLGTRAWLCFFIGIPLQILTLLWFIFITVKKRNKKTKFTQKV